MQAAGGSTDPASPGQRDAREGTEKQPRELTAVAFFPEMTPEVVFLFPLAHPGGRVGGRSSRPAGD